MKVLMFVVLSGLNAAEIAGIIVASIFVAVVTVLGLYTIVR